LLLRILGVLGVAGACFAPFMACGGSAVVGGGGGTDGSGGGQGGSSGGACSLTSTGTNGSTLVQLTACFAPGPNGCPPPWEAAGWVSLESCDSIASVDCGPVIQDGECCYLMTKSFNDANCGGGGGRPFVVNGSALTARVTTGARDWLADGRAPDVAALAAEDRAALAAAWTADALFEHASVASFAQLSLALMGAGAPSPLIEAAHRAALDEVNHARACFALASAYTGGAVGPSAITFPKTLSITTDLVELAEAAAREGCIGETVSAALAAQQLAGASDPAVVEVLSALAEEEAQHAELSWRIVAWAVRAGGERVRTQVARVFDEASRHLPAPVADLPVNEAIRAHGRLDAASHRRAAESILRDVVLPSARALLAPSRESLAAFAAS